MDYAATGSESDPDDRTIILGDDPDPRFGESLHAPELDIGSTRGRYAVIGILGRGAMGRVLRAYDPTLQREVALKLVSAQALDPHARDRILREAQAMAQLSHPNVVSVFDVEQSDDELALVMEYVPGQTLKRWVKKQRPSWPEVVVRFVEAGKGLAAAHAAGLLHRDFKPDNVLLSDDGTVKVTDFGLAKLSSTDSRSLTGSVRVRVGDDDDNDNDNDNDEPRISRNPLDLSSSGSSSTLDVELTQAGTVMGTPRYMAPEQHRGDPLEPSADQYAFCLSLWEALTGSVPHHADSLEEIYVNKRSGPPAWPSKAPAVPRRLIEAVRRGLRADPHDRWPSMEALIEVLADDPRRRRNRWIAGLGAAGLLLAAGAGWWSVQAERCTGAAEHLAGVWDDARREQVRGAILGLERSFVQGVWDRTQARLDRYTDEWVAMHVEACEATTVRGEQSSAVMDLRMACLQDARLGLEAITGVLSEADIEVIRNADDVLGDLPRLDRCADVDGLLGAVEPPPPEEAEAVEGIRRLLAESEAEVNAGRYDRSLAIVERAKATLDTIEYEPIRTEVALEESYALLGLGRFDEAEATLRAGMQTAARWRQLDILEETAEQLMLVVGYHQSRTAEGLALWEVTLGLALKDPQLESSARNVYAGVLSIEGKLAEAEAEYRRSLELLRTNPEYEEIDGAVRHSNIGLILTSQGRYDEAEAELRRALTVVIEHFGPAHPKVGLFHNNLANSLIQQGKYDEAEAELRLAWTIQEDGLGAEHPDVALAINNLGQVLYRKGELEEAERSHRDALERQLKAYESTHPLIGNSHNNLGNVLHGRGLYAEAEQEFRRALPILEATLGPDHPSVCQTRSNLGTVLHDQGKDDEAEPVIREALTRWVDAVGADHPDVGIARNNLALVLYARKQYDEAIEQYRRVLSSWEAVLGPEHPNLGTIRNNLSKALLKQGKLAEAEVEQRRSLEIAVAALGPEHADVARGHHNLGRLLLERGQPEEALVEAQKSLTLWEAALGPEHPNVASALLTLAEIALEQDRPKDAVPLAERALERQMKEDGLPDMRAASAFALARALWFDGRAASQDRARTLAEQAIGWFIEAKEDKDVADVRAWQVDPRRWTPRRLGSTPPDPSP